VLKLAAKELDCFVLGVDHFGKSPDAGTRGGSSKESSGDLVLACLGERELSGRVVNTRVVIRKCRGGRTGQEYYFGVREVQLPECDEDGEPVSTLVIEWGAQQQQSAKRASDPWEEGRQATTRQAMLLLKRVMMAKLAEHGVELPLEPPVRGIDREIVREEFYAQTPVDGTKHQKEEQRRKRFNALWNAPMRNSWSESARSAPSPTCGSSSRNPTRRRNSNGAVLIRPPSSFVNLRAARELDRKFISCDIARDGSGQLDCNQKPSCPASCPAP
jgi:hypothetical protein